MSRATARDHERPRVGRVVSGLRRLAFWGSVVLPFLYLLLLMTPIGLSGALGDQELLTLGGLVGLNVLCLVLGHDYIPDHV